MADYWCQSERFLWHSVTCYELNIVHNMISRSHTSIPGRVTVSSFYNAHEAFSVSVT